MLKIVMITAEMAPYAKAGGLADVTAALPDALRHLGQETIVIMPAYGTDAIKTAPLECVARNVQVEIDRKNSVTCSFKKLTKDRLTPVYFVSHYDFFGKHTAIYHGEDSKRFYFFNVAALKLLEIINFQPDIIHCHDWHAGLVPQLIKERQPFNIIFKNTKTVLTIHNLGYQGAFKYSDAKNHEKDYRNHRIPPFNSPRLRRVNFMKRAILHADKINTVSMNYSREILTPEFGEGLDPYLRERKKDLIGITNGIDYKIFSPKTDPYVKVPFDHNSLDKKLENKAFLQRTMGLPVNTKIPVIGIASRITEQKGFDIFLEIADSLLKENQIQIIGVGSTSPKYRQALTKLMKKFPDKIKISMQFSVELASQIYAGSDMFLMPSRYEPCGLGQMISLRYGSIPIVRSTGGLADTIEDFDPSFRHGNGFVFREYSPFALMNAIIRALTSYKYKDSWEKLVRRAMKLSFSWEIPSKKYLKLYREALKNA